MHSPRTAWQVDATPTDTNTHYRFSTLLLPCRLGARGVQAAAADPGAVRTNIYNNSPKLGKGFIKTMIDNCYAPPEDGAQVFGHSCLLTQASASSAITLMFAPCYSLHIQ